MTCDPFVHLGDCLSDNPTSSYGTSPPSLGGLRNGRKISAAVVGNRERVAAADHSRRRGADWRDMEIGRLGVCPENGWA